MREVDTQLGSTETTAVQRDGQQSFLGWRVSCWGHRVGLVGWEGEVLRGLGRCELASHPETESVLRITQGREGEGKAPLRHETVEEREEQEGEKRHCFGEDGEMRPGFSLGSSAEGPGAFPIWGASPPLFMGSMSSGGAWSRVAESPGVCVYVCALQEFSTLPGIPWAGLRLFHSGSCIFIS